MRTLKIIYHDSVEHINTINVRHICNLSIGRGYEDSKDSYIVISWGGSSEVIQLPSEKAYELYNKLASWLSNNVTNLEVELLNGMMSGKAIDYIVVEK